MISWDHVSLLRRDIGDAEFNAVVTLFFEEVEGRLTCLRDAPDPATLQSDLHFLRSNMLSLGFADASVLCHAGEKLSAEGAANEVELDDIFGCYANSKRLFLDGLAKSKLVHTSL
ncbi:hypothetical protein SAMN04488523_105160 [Sulfitobacter brevis]|uniref:Hpt domain-containing protein n=1 Tax=Sulfitobacter brevis TaxID=74348 RepID=A0A1I1Y773_9RHOB|nr:Hpt domain-containing protein [Sulfitobacter brevis]SFE15447.1 hypothetical protein SAMN04488523_105160 [Sulfitobacter brevis]